MRIVLCITTLETGGAERAMTHLALGLRDAGCEIVVAVLQSPPSPPRHTLHERLVDAAVPVTFLHAKRAWQVVRVARELRHLLETHRPQVVQSFLHHANVLGAWAASRAGIAAMLTGIRVAERRTNTHRWLARRIDPLVRRHVCVSQDVAGYARTEIGLPAEKLVVIHNGVELPPALGGKPPLPADLRLPADRSMLVYAGRLDRQKRLPWMLARMPAIFAGLPRHDLLLVGEGPEQRSLEDTARRLGIQDRVHFLPWRPDVRTILAAADLLLLSSAWEGLPNILLEAMACGLPAVCTEAEGIAEALGPGASTQLVDPEDAIRYEKLVVRIGTERSLREALGRENRARVARHFSLDAMVGRYLDLYRQLREGE